MIKKVDKRSGVVIWDRNDYAKEAEIEISNQNAYKMSSLKKKKHDFFKSLRASGIISEKEL